MKKSFILLAALLLFFISCKKEVTQVASQAHGIVYTIKPEDWSTDDDSLSFTASFNVPELNNAIYDHGAVIVYLSFGNNLYEALPEVFDGISYGAIHSQGAVSVDFHAVDGGKVAPPGGDVIAKIVLIAADKIALHPNVDLRNYEEVKKVFHIKD